MSLSHKINRYLTLIRRFKNWPAFLVFKSGAKKSFHFKMRNGFEIEVTRKMLPPFKESFFDGIYLKHFPKTKIIQNPTIIDIGANVGFFSLAMFSQFPKAKIVAFEPMPFNFNQLKAYHQLFPGFNWKIENKAVSDNNDGLTLFTSTIEGFSTMAGVFASDNRAEKIVVPTLTMGQVMEEHRIDKIDLLKLDCEGSEYSILYNLDDILLKKIGLLSIESHPGAGVDQNHDSLLNFLRSKSFLTKDQINSDGTGYIWAWR